MADTLADIFKKHKEIKLTTKDTFHLQANPGIYYIKQGLIKTYTHNKGKAFLFNVEFENDILGLEGALKGESKTEKSHEVIGECILYYMNENDFMQLLSKNTSFMIEIMRYLSEKSDKIEKRISNINSKNVSKNFLELLASFNYRNIKTVMPNILSTDDVANLIGTTKNYVYKIIQRLENQLIISFKHRRLRIINNELLQKQLH